MESDNLHRERMKESRQDGQEGTRKLAAIMFTDIKDFSGKMQKDEAATMRMLKVHNQIIDEAVARNSGMIVKTIGDAYLVSFDSVVSATLCAIEAQQTFYEHNAQVQSQDEKIEVRIGVHLGDVIVKDNDVFGDGVNIASRIQSIAEVGGVNISESVYQQVRNKITIRVLNLGVPQLKGINQSIKVYQVIVIPTDKARGKLATNIFVLQTILKRKKTKRVLGIGFLAAAVLVFAWIFLLAPAPPPNSLAILPFKNLGDPANEYIADGFAQDLNTDLSKLGDVRVLSEGSTREFKNTSLSEKDIAKELGVRYLLTGNIEVGPNDITVRWRLTDPSKNLDVLNQNFTKSRDEILGIQHEIFRQVALRFQSELGFSSTTKISRDVYDLYSRGLEYDRRDRKEDNQMAISFFQQAVERDSGFGQGFLKLASSELLNHERDWDHSEKWLTDAEHNIKKAFALDSSNAEVYWLFGRLFIARGDRKQGIAFLERSIQKNPNLARAYNILGREYLINLNDPGKAVIFLTKAFELEPTDYFNSMNLGIAHAILKNYSEAIKSFRRAVVLNPGSDVPWINLGIEYERTSSIDSAGVAFRNAVQRNPRDPMTNGFLAAFLINRGRLVQAESTLTACLQYEPNDYRMIYLLGLAKNREGEGTSANAIWKNGMRLADAGSVSNPNVSEHYLYVALFSARLGLADSALLHCKSAVAMDSSADNVMGMARIYAILGKKQEMIDWFKRARTMSAEFDTQFLATEIDFETFRSDPDLILAAR